MPYCKESTSIIFSIRCLRSARESLLPRHPLLGPTITPLSLQFPSTEYILSLQISWIQRREIIKKIREKSLIKMKQKEKKNCIHASSTIWTQLVVNLLPFFFFFSLFSIPINHVTCLFYHFRLPKYISLTFLMLIIR